MTGHYCVGEFSSEMGHPGILFTEIDDVKTIIIELASLKKKNTLQGSLGSLAKASFKSPQKKKGIKDPKTSSKLGTIAAFMEVLIEKGDGLQEVKEALLSKGLVDQDDPMDVDYLFESVKKRRFKEAAASMYGASIASTDE